MRPFCQRRVCLPVFSRSACLLLVSVLLPVSILFLSSCKGRKPNLSAGPPEGQVIELKPRDVSVYKEWVGSLDGSVNAQIRCQVTGYLLKQNYQEGSAVKKGDLLFEIDPRQFQAALDQARGQLDKAQAQLVKTQQDVARYTPLAQEMAISQQELDDAVQANQAAKAAVDSARAAVEQAQLNLGYTKIVSPVDGVAGIAQGQVGDLVGQSTVLTTVSQLDPMKVYFPISEQEYLQAAERVSQVSAVPESQRKATLELVLADGSVYKEKGTFSATDRQVDAKTGTLRVAALFPNSGNLLRPGQYAKVRAAVETRSGALLVPQRAVTELQGIFQVAVVGADNTVDIRTVKPGSRIGTDWIIDEGLKAGDRVVVEGVQKVRDGIVVSPAPYTDASGSPRTGAPG